MNLHFVMTYIQRNNFHKNHMTAVNLFTAVFLVVCLLFQQPVWAAEENICQYIDDVLEYECSVYEVSSVQQLLDEGYSKEPLNGVNETFVMAIYQYDMKNPNIDFSYEVYINSMKEAFPEYDSMKCTSVQKSAELLITLGGEDDIVMYAYDNTIGQQGIMSYIYGIRLLSAMNESDIYVGCDGWQEMLDNSISSLIEFQLDDGGFCYSGNEGDSDITAMTLKALAPYYEYENVKTSVDRALAFLSDIQLENGDFPSFEKGTSESTSQVQLALSALNIDEYNDNFVKNGHTVLDGILLYSQENGSFSHTIEGGPNEMASSQALEAMVSCIKDVKTSYDLSLNLIISIIIASVAFIYILFVWLLMFKKNKKKAVRHTLSCLCVALLCIIIVNLLDFETKDEYAKADTTQKDTENITVSITIICETALEAEAVNDKTDFESILPEDGVMLEETSVTIEYGGSVSDVLATVCRDYDIMLDQDVSNSGPHSMAYVRGIGYLYEFDFGDLSGWMYSVNGEYPGVGCGEYILSEGDMIVWAYTCDLGHDLE